MAAVAGVTISNVKYTAVGCADGSIFLTHPQLTALNTFAHTTACQGADCPMRQLAEAAAQGRQLPGVPLGTMITEFLVTAPLTVGALSPSSTGLAVNPAESSVVNVAARLGAINGDVPTVLNSTIVLWSPVLETADCAAPCAAVQGASVPGTNPVVNGSPLPVPTVSNSSPSLLWLVCVPGVGGGEVRTACSGCLAAVSPPPPPPTHPPPSLLLLLIVPCLFWACASLAKPEDDKRLAEEAARASAQALHQV